MGGDTQSLRRRQVPSHAGFAPPPPRLKPPTTIAPGEGARIHCYVVVAIQRRHRTHALGYFPATYSRDERGSRVSWWCSAEW